MAYRPKPAHLHVINGNPSQFSAKELAARLAAEPKCLADLTAAPDWLTVEQKESWAHAVSHAPIGLMKEIDRTVLIQWCIAECEYIKAAKQMQTQPQLYRDKNKEVRRNPLIFIIKHWSDELKALGNVLGFNPIARTRIGLANQRGGDSDDLPTDPWEELASM